MSSNINDSNDSTIFFAAAEDEADLNAASAAVAATTSSITTPLLQESATSKRSARKRQGSTSSSSATSKSLELANNNNNTSSTRNINNNEEENKKCTCTKRKFCLVLFSPFTDSTGSASTILPGLFFIVCIGTILGFALPKESSLPTPWYRTFSSIIGYVYFTAWSISFYPQVFMNYRRKKTQGLSIDFVAMNVLGFACYAVYNASLFWSPYIQKLYRENHSDGEMIPVRSNDVAFALHALVLSLLTLLQMWYYDGLYSQTTKMSKPISFFFVGVFLVLTIATIVVSVSSRLTWLSFLYLLSYIKVVITLLKYIPQVILNYRRKSTMGWNIWNIILDFTGGMLSLAQLLGDSADMHDWSAITGNFAKFCLGFVSIFFDIIFFIQHYILYPDKNGGEENESPQQNGQENESPTPWSLINEEEGEEEYDFDALL